MYRWGHSPTDDAETRAHEAIASFFTSSAGLRVDRPALVVDTTSGMVRARVHCHFQTIDLRVLLVVPPVREWFTHMLACLLVCVRSKAWLAARAARACHSSKLAYLALGRGACRCASLFKFRARFLIVAMWRNLQSFLTVPYAFEGPINLVSFFGYRRGLFCVGFLSCLAHVFEVPVILYCIVSLVHWHCMCICAVGHVLSVSLCALPSRY